MIWSIIIEALLAALTAFATVIVQAMVARYSPQTDY
jgi:hypothetical protein